MEFDKKKLPLEVVPEMRVCALHSVQPYAPLPAPLYVLLTSNEKFLAVKGPLDFLTPSDLERLSGFEVFFYPPFIKQVLPFRHIAHLTRDLFWGARHAEGVPPAPFELSDAFLRMSAPLWSKDARVEPFFVNVFVTELCGPFQSDLVLGAREKSLAVYEQSLLKSAWAVWQALHLDHFDIDVLRALRDGVFNLCAHGADFSLAGFDREWILAFSESELAQRPYKLSDFSVGVIASKLAARERRLCEELIQLNAEIPPSIFGDSALIKESA